MSHYGPPGGPYSGQPQDPWPNRQQPQDPYDQPSDPWSGHDPWGGAPASTPPSAPGSPGPGSDPGYGYGSPSSPAGPGYDTGYGSNAGYSSNAGYNQGYDPGYASAPAPSPVWSPSPAQPAKRKTSAPLLAAIAVLALLVCGGGSVAAYYLLKNDETPVSQPTTPTNSGAATPKPSASAGESPVSSTDARFATKGQCLVNKGSNDKPTMSIAKCAAGTYEVLARFDGTKDYAGKCGGGKVPGYQYYYFFDSDLDTLDFVLCLKKR